ncbi:MAG TPA: alkaline phosphatase family protein [Vicinamibacteria bacterium]|nr:alkaline phosphatase family protein [Vicinamibacteria bacterium]
MSKPVRRSILVAVAGAVVVTVGIAWSRRPVPEVKRLVLLGFDGVSPNLLEPLVAQGKLPAIRRLMDRGSYGPLRSFRPAKSGVLWTSIATGKSMLKHGIVDWTYVNEQGIEVPYQGEGRRAKTYWEILAERGLRTGTINWWVTYPPRPVANSYVVSSAFRLRQHPSTVDPPRLFDWLNALRLRRPAVPAEMKERGVPDWSPEEATLPLGSAEPILLAYGAYFAQDVTIDRVSDYLWVQQPVEVFSTYFRLVDVTSHFAEHFMDRRVHDEVAALEAAGKATPADVARLDREMARVTAHAYQFMDGIIAKYLERMDEHTALIVCSDHGFRFFKGHYDHYAPGLEAPDGVLFLAGPGVRGGHRIAGASLLDIAPTILHWMGQPVAEDMDGGVLRQALEEHVRWNPVRTVATYESGATAAGTAPADPAVSEEVLEDLRTLGYIEAPAGGTPRPSPTPR